MNDYESLGSIKSIKEEISFNKIISDFDRVFDNSKSTKEDIINVMKKYVPNLEHVETGKNLDQKM